MRKFKIKNKQKRRYLRKSKISAQTYPSKSALILVPPFVLIIAVFSIFIFFKGNPFIFRPAFNFSLPSIQAMSPEYFYQKVGKIRIPDFSLKIDLPQMSVAPLLTFLGVLNEEVVKFIAKLVPVILNILVYLDPRPIIMTTLDSVLWFLRVLDKIVGDVFLASIQFIIYITQWTAAFVKNGFIYTIKTLGSFVITVTEVAGVLLKQVFSFLLFLILTIKDIIIALVIKIGEFFIYTIEAIRSPFVRLGKDLQVFTPLFNQIFRILADSARDLIINQKNLFKFILSSHINSV